MNDGEKWNIGYYQGGDYVNYRKHLIAVTKGLMALGWIADETIPETAASETRRLWRWLSSEAESKYLSFAEDAFYSADWKDDNREKIVPAMMQRLKNRELDLMMAMGTYAGQDLSNDRHSVPTIVLSTSDPIASGIIKSVEDSGRDHVHARVDPYQYERQVRLFHDILSFDKLGVAYEDTVRGRTYAAIEQIEKVADEKNSRSSGANIPNSSTT